MKGLLIYYDFFSQTLPIRREVDRSPTFRPWDFSKRMEGSYTEQRLQNRGHTNSISFVRFGTGYIGNGKADTEASVNQDREEHDCNRFI